MQKTHTEKTDSRMHQLTLSPNAISQGARASAGARVTGLILMLLIHQQVALAGTTSDSLAAQSNQQTSTEDKQINPNKRQGKQDSKYMSSNSGHEPVSNVAYDGKTLTLEVISNGCTHADHFSIQHEQTIGQCRLTIIRDKPDYCRRVPFPVAISINWQLPEPCNSAVLTIANPLMITGPIKGRLPITRSPETKATTPEDGKKTQ